MSEDDSDDDRRRLKNPLLGLLSTEEVECLVLEVLCVRVAAGAGSTGVAFLRPKRGIFGDLIGLVRVWVVERSV